MNRFLVLLFLLWTPFTFANIPDIYCDDDTGEAMSEVYDAYDTAMQFEIVGLDPRKYPLLIRGFGVKKWNGLGIWQIAELEKKTKPEIFLALAKWVGENCPANHKD